MCELQKNQYTRYTSKIICRLIISRLADRAKERIIEEKGRFRRGEVCVEQIFVLRQWVEKQRKKKKELYVVYIDFKNACREEAI